MRLLLGLIVLLAFSVPPVSRAGTEDDENLRIAETCVSAENPKACMEAYGNRCRQSRSLSTSLDAQHLGCNRPLGDGRMYFTQMAYDDGHWVIENQHSYLPELAEDKPAYEDPQAALSAYITGEMKGFSMMSGGSLMGRRPKPFSFETGRGKEGEERVLRAVCGALIVGVPDETLASDVLAACERALLRTIRQLSQPAESGPFRASGANEIEWQTRSATLLSGDAALIVTGRHVFQPEFRPCLLISDCCSLDGQSYLMSCRTPTDAERQAISSCLERERRPWSEEFQSCLREQQVKVGCEDQPDGSRLCY